MSLRLLLQEHSVMYPIDLLKVSFATQFDRCSYGINTDYRSTDSIASRQSYTGRHLHWHRQCAIDHFKS
jgi:hypothetical protein